MTTKTNGSTPTPSRDQIIREATYYAAIHGYYDTSEAAQKANLLTVSAFDMGSMEKLPANASHKFYIMVDATAYMVTRLKNGNYQVEEHDQEKRHQQERETRAAVFDYAVYYLTGTGAGYMPGDGDEAREKYIKELLEDEDNYDHYEEEEQPESDKHPIIRDEEVTIAVGEGFVSGPAQPCSRQWYVQIGPAHCCHVGLYRADNDQPEFV